MADITPINPNQVVTGNTDITALTEAMLLDVHDEPIQKENSISMPIAQLSTLGAAVSSLIPALNTVTQTSTIGVPGYYQIANMGIQDTLKVAKNGNFWGAFKTPDGVSKFAQLKEADPLTATNKLALNANPAMLMMSVALFSIEKDLGQIADMEKQILSFLEVEKESEIEADVITLNEIITKYKHNWDNEHYVASNHKMVCDIQRTARKNMLSFQKAVAEAIKDKKVIVGQGQVNSTLENLQKKFKYYRLALYTFSLASMTEIMLSGNFKEDNISTYIDEINKHSDEYRTLFGECSEYLEKMSKKSLEANLLKGIGKASGAVGKFIGSIPKIKEGQADEFLQEKGEKIELSANDISRDVMTSFEEVSDPNTGIFVGKLEDMVRIYDRTTKIAFDKEKIYLIA